MEILFVILRTDHNPIAGAVTGLIGCSLIYLIVGLFKWIIGAIRGSNKKWDEISKDETTDSRQGRY